MIRLARDIVITGVAYAAGVGLLVAVYTAPLWMSDDHR